MISLLGSSLENLRVTLPNYKKDHDVHPSWSLSKANMGTNSYGSFPKLLFPKWGEIYIGPRILIGAQI